MCTLDVTFVHMPTGEYRTITATASTEFLCIGVAGANLNDDWLWCYSEETIPF
mgnify:CR=1 FL=1